MGASHMLPTIGNPFLIWYSDCSPSRMLQQQFRLDLYSKQKSCQKNVCKPCNMMGNDLGSGDCGNTSARSSHTAGTGRTMYVHCTYIVRTVPAGQERKPSPSRDQFLQYHRYHLSHNTSDKLHSYITGLKTTKYLYLESPYCSFKIY